MTYQQQIALENKEIRGLSWKSLLALIVATISICSTVLVSYSSLTAQIVRVRSEAQADKDILKQAVESDRKYTELRFLVMDKTLTLLQLQIDDLKKK